MDKQAELHESMTAVISEIVENHPCPTTEVMASDIASSLIEVFDLRASKLFVNDNDGSRPVEHLRFIDGRLVVSSYSRA